MNEKNTNTLLTTYPKLYKDMSHFECGDGWFDLLNRLSCELENLIIEDIEPSFIVDQVKEKLGGLRFYVTGATSEMLNLIEEACKESYFICETCGQKGSLNDENRWYLKVRCENCAKKEREMRNKT